MAATTYQRNQILDKCFGSTDFTPPATHYIGICTGCSTDGVIVGEPTIGASGYTRMAVDNDKVTWDSAASGALSNLISVTFPQASGDWGILDTIIISSAASGNINTLFYDTMIERIILDQDVFSFATGKIDISM
jgi:hypothetical protein